MTTDTTEKAPLTVQERLDAAIAVRNERKQKEDEENKLRRAVILELEAQLSAQLGRRGEDFQIVDGGPFGPIGVKPPSAIAYKQYRAKLMKDKETQEDLIALVNPCVIHPETKKFGEIVAAKPALYDVLGARVLELGGLWEEKEAGK
jgi:hypothetical protein